MEKRARAGQAKAAFAAFATLFFVMCGHSILETARDALFLRSLPVAQLPWVYLIIAALTFVVAALESAVAHVVRRRDMLALFLVFASVVTATLFFAADFVSVSLWILYVWTGLFGSVAALHFWLSVSAAVTVTDAKRLFGFIGAGALVGAMVGSALARLLVSLAETRVLVVAAALMMMLGAAVARFALRPALARLGGAKIEEVAPPRPPAPAREAVASLRRDPYARLVVSFVFLSTLALTLVDYLFKQEVVLAIAPAELGSFFATFHIASNAIALLAQLVLVRRLLDRIGVNYGLSILPTLLFAGGLWAALGSGLSAVMLLKAGDGSLRHSLHRTATEILFVPLPSADRDRVKTVSDVVGHRGGQAIGSVLILIGVWAIGGGSWIAWTIAAISLAATAIAIGARGPYLDVFRRRIGAEPDRTIGRLPPLDRRALRALSAALASPEEREVLAALELLREQDRVDLVPALVLAHSSPRVVSYALQCFVEAGRADFVPAGLRLLDTAGADVRAAVLRAIAAVSPDEVELREALNEPSARVRATAIVALAALGRMHVDEARRRLHDIIDEPAVRLAICAALAVRPYPALADLLLELAADGDRSVRAEAISAIAASGDRRLWPALLASVRERALRPLARRGFLDAGQGGLTFLIEALEAEDLPHEIRLHVPRSISVFASDVAARALVLRLGTERDLRVRHKILRALGRLARTQQAKLELDTEAITRLFVVTIDRCRLLAIWRRAMAMSIAEDPHRDTTSGEVLSGVLFEELAFELEHVFRVLALLHGGEDFHSIHRGFESEDVVTRASSHELLRAVLPHDDANALLDIVRIRMGGEVEDPGWAVISGDAALAAMIAGESATVAAMAAAYAAEVGAFGVLSHVEARLARGGAPELAPVFEAASRRLGGSVAEIAID